MAKRAAAKPNGKAPGTKGAGRKGSAPSAIGANNRPEAERSGILFYYAQKLKALLADLRAAQEAIKDAKKAMLEDGVMPKQAAYLVGVSKRIDKQAPIDEIKWQLDILAQMKLAPELNLEMLKDRKTKEEKAFDSGWLSGAMAEDRASGYAPSSAEDSLWLDGYDKAQASQREAMQTAMEAARKKRQQQTAELVKAANDDDKTNAEREKGKQDEAMFQ